MADIKRNGGNGRRSLSAVHGGVVYTAGITSTDLDGDITAQAKDVLQVIDNVLQRAGTDKTRILSASITLANMAADYGTFNAVWDEWVQNGAEPPRSVVGGALAVPEYKIKVSVIAAV